MMNTDFVFVGEDSTREEVLQWLRGQEINFDQLDTIVLLDVRRSFRALCRSRDSCWPRPISA